MAIYVSDLITRAQTILQDTTSQGIRWPRDELLGWLNDAYREIVGLRPDASSKYDEFVCVPGTRQNLHRADAGMDAAIQLLDVSRNLGGNGGAIRKVDRVVLDDQRRTWHTEGSTESIEMWAQDPRSQREFFVYPPALAAARVEVLYSFAPAVHDSEGEGTGEIRLLDIYANPILDFMLYRAYQKDVDYAANDQRSATHYQAVYNALGLQNQAQQEAARSTPEASPVRPARPGAPNNSNPPT